MILNLPGEILGRDGSLAEDVGGVPGYYEFCQAMKDPHHPEHQSYMEWCGGEYDSEKFKTGEVNLELMKYLRWSRERSRPWQKKA